MEATAVSLARSVLDGVLSSAGSAIADEVASLLGVPKEVEFIRNELEMMQSFLKVASSSSGHPERNDIVRTWVKQVRELAYDVEDCLLDFALYAARTSSSSSSCSSSWLPSAVAARHRIASRIRDLKASVEALNQRNLRYHIGVSGSGEEAHASSSSSSVLPDPDHHHDAAELDFEASGIIGRDSDKEELTRLLLLISGGGSGTGSCGRAGGRGGRVGDGRHGEILAGADGAQRPGAPGRELGMPPAAGGEDVDVQDYLREKRYLVIVDDLLGHDEWENVWQVFPRDNRRGSRIIVTTRREDVARQCAGHAAEGHRHVYELKPLGKEQSMDLLCRKVYKTTDYPLPEDMAKQASYILKRCRGLPLAISTIGGLLANRPKTSIEWRNLHEHLGAELESDLRNITNVIVSSYDGLPYHLKSIFLYLSVFPENHEIRRTRLLRRWMAEGYIAKNRDMPVEDVAERFFSELINRSMIQPSKTSPGVRADRCRVHGMVLQIILFMFTEENQLFLIEKHSNEVPQSKIRHLVVSRWKRRGEKLLGINMSYVRSLTIIGECPSSIISPKLRLLRVLDLEDTENLNDDDLKHIGELYHLRYLCLRGTKISRLPSSLQKLRYLETLDIQDTKVTRLPDGIAKLEKLRYLLAGVNLARDLLLKVEELGMDTQKTNVFGNITSSLCYNCNEYCMVSGVDQLSVRAPEGIEKLRNLHMLGMVNVGQGSGVAGRLKKLTNLRRLGAAGFNEEEGQELWKSIGKLNRLQRLEMRSESIKFLAAMDESTVPRHLVSLRLCGNLGSLPKWVSSLNDLAKVKLLGTQLDQEDIVHLQNLPNLVSLGLWVNSYIGVSLCFSTGTFPKLKFLDIDGLQQIETVTIEKGAIPELEQLWVNKCTSLRDDNDGLSGVQYLPNLNELLLKKCGEKKRLIETLQRQVNKHVRRPKFLIGKSIPQTNPNVSTSTTTEQ
ncbi:hypothetical protein PR202_gb23015 [Eleusine coracana subsp. coracana]|uniref:Uncharacterized protein n=1 Tax=Eleusine coracana subsp. coracana TaxID=191504 RepID=A0AAV5FF88_ELECO|nr:hypothetical protein PR202_gb23015 [Eleusine coracana subsp. coracana]